ncbi:conjugal transfer protein TraR [Pseudomonas syringae pv. syringae]|uniref:DUF6750 family protein n=1 Tax=Pseudomonas syringae TaxID=317 RepID=UPI00200B4F99|nr:DUF6750 family protein [Pseudomonas syringae]MCK9759828.1 conjugal transfer protein TraR [Pseudomonas syringae pv. syringae]MCK9774819.1 conjugal transfer protein TraR [Pseudomonas syringae pv. syringae]
MSKNIMLRACVRVQMVSDKVRTSFVKSITALAAASPVTAFAAEDIAGMFNSVASGSTSGTKSALTIAQFAGVLFVIGGVVAAKAKKNNPSITVGAIVTALVTGILLIAVPELIKRSQTQVGLKPITVG